MSRPFLSGLVALALATLGASQNARADDAIDKDGMIEAIYKFRRENLILGGLTLTGGLASMIAASVFIYSPQYHERRKPGIPLLVFGQLQGVAGTYILLTGIFGTSNDMRLELAPPADYQRLVLPAKLRDAHILQYGLIADLAITGLSLPLLFPIKSFKDWFGFGVLMVVEGVFSAATAYACHRSLEAYINSIERYGKFVAPPMDPQSARPILFDMKFAF